MANLDVLTRDSAQNDALTTHSTQAPDNQRDVLTRDSAQNDALTPHSTRLVIGLDWERDGWRVSENGLPAKKVSRDALLAMPFSDAHAVIVEQAHMRERNAYSVAQVYTADELDRLACRDKIRLFPGMPGQLAKAAREVGNITNETNEYGSPLPDKTKDAETMALWALQSPRRMATWKPLRRAEDDPSRHLWPARDALRDDLREALNPLRAAWNAKPTAERYALPEVANFCSLLDTCFDKLTNGVKEQFGIRRSRNGIRVERMAAAITCYLALYDRGGNLRMHNGEPYGTRFILRAIGLSSSYRPNIARSQLTHHGMRHYKGGRDGGKRAEYMRNLRNFLAVLREAPDVLTPDSAQNDALTLHSTQEQNGDVLTSDSAQNDALTHHSTRRLLEAV